MNNRIGLLSVLAVVQLVLIGIFAIGSSQGDRAVSQLIDLSVADVDRFRISDGEQEVEIIRNAEGWQVAGVPADDEKVTSILAKLADLEAPWPVATSGSSAQRFEVDAGNFQRHVQLYQAGASIAELYLGTSPGYQRVHARRADNDGIYSVALSNYELGVSPDDWIDKAVLALSEAPERIELTVSGPGSQSTTLVSTDEGWMYNDEAANQDEVATYANRFTTLQVLGLADGKSEGGLEFAEQGRVAVTAGDQTQIYVISSAGEDDYVIRTQAGDVSFRLATYIAEQLLARDAEFAAAPDSEN